MQASFQEAFRFQFQSSGLTSALGGQVSASRLCFGVLISRKHSAVQFANRTRKDRIGDFSRNQTYRLSAETIL